MLNRSNIETKVIPMSTQMFPMHSPEEQKSSVNNAPLPRVLLFGDFHLDVKKAELFKDGARVRLQGKFSGASGPAAKAWRNCDPRRIAHATLAGGYPRQLHANVNTTVNKLAKFFAIIRSAGVCGNNSRKGYSFVAKVIMPIGRCPSCVATLGPARRNKRATR